MKFIKIIAVLIWIFAGCQILLKDMDVTKTQYFLCWISLIAMNIENLVHCIDGPEYR